MYGPVIKKALRSNEAIELLVDATGGGPCDGGCLICARAIIRAVGRGTLVRLHSRSQTEHYGARVDDIIYDGDGAHSPRTWPRKVERIYPGLSLAIAEGLDEDSPIPDDARTVKELTAILSRALEGATKP